MSVRWPRDDLYFSSHQALDSLLKTLNSDDDDEGQVSPQSQERTEGGERALVPREKIKSFVRHCSKRFPRELHLRRKFSQTFEYWMQIGRKFPGLEYDRRL